MQRVNGANCHCMSNFVENEEKKKKEKRETSDDE